MTPGMGGAAVDPIFGVAGDLAVNWHYSNNGARIALSGGHLSAAGANDDDTHGLGNELGASTGHVRGAQSADWWHDASIIQGDCHGGSCVVQGTDHGTKLQDGTMYGQYAIYVSPSADSFPCPGPRLRTEMPDRNSGGGAWARLCVRVCECASVSGCVCVRARARVTVRMPAFVRGCVRECNGISPKGSECAAVQCPLSRPAPATQPQSTSRGDRQNVWDVTHSPAGSAGLISQSAHRGVT